MARLKHIKSGAIVSVADEKVERLGAEWVPVEAHRAFLDEPKRLPGRPKKTDN